jgi:hypothetical protein
MARAVRAFVATDPMDRSSFGSLTVYASIPAWDRAFGDLLRHNFSA